ncbi:hypothetical protein CEXT_725461 [Caerostris extrusa]|uniref:Uncharacterized protein n=1 Tax=Caerostris extrusa TaxID=172846 RepID=A0AAV4YB17_CAEEX|nr:hypothetical protein CEXT_725461 [Caerostris extrusa]
MKCAKIGLAHRKGWKDTLVIRDITLVERIRHHQYRPINDYSYILTKRDLINSIKSFTRKNRRHIKAWAKVSGEDTYPRKAHSALLHKHTQLRCNKLRDLNMKSLEEGRRKGVGCEGMKKLGMGEKWETGNFDRTKTYGGSEAAKKSIAALTSRPTLQSLGPQSCLCALSLSSLLGRKVDSTLCKLEIAVPVVPPTGGGDFQQVLIAAPTSAGGCLCCDAPMLRRKGRRKGVAVKEFTGLRAKKSKNDWPKRVDGRWSNFRRSTVEKRRRVADGDRRKQQTLWDGKQWLHVEIWSEET